MTLLDDQLGKGELDELRALGRLAEEVGCRLFIVGGWVRDLLLERRHKDRDLTVEGDARAFAQALATQYRFGVVPRVEWHERFLTATVTWPTEAFIAPTDAAEVKAAWSLQPGMRIDVATTRREVYEFPGALPTVSPSDIATDLWRRDFACNALAVCLSPADFGRLVDPCGGSEDIRHGILRILHERSFIDDPTRILRAVSFEQRLGFRIEDRTLNLLRAAVASGALQTISADRISAVLHHSLAGDAAVDIIIRLTQLGIWEALGAPGDIAHISLSGVERALDDMGLCDPATRATVYLLMVGLAGDDTAWISSFLDTQEHTALTKAAEMLREPPEALRKPDAKPSEVRFALEGIPPAVSVVLYARLDAEAQRRILRCWREWQHVTPDITGDDLLQAGCPPGPAFKAALQAALALKLDACASRDKQLALALEIASYAQC